MQDQDTREMDLVDTARPRRWYVVGGLVIVSALALVFVARFTATLVGGDPWNVDAGQEVVVTVSPGTPASSIYQTLDDARVARAGQLRDAARAVGGEDQLQAGTYIFVTDMDPSDVVRKLLRGGDVVDGALFTLVEGWTIDRILDELALQTTYMRSDFETALLSGAVISPFMQEPRADISSLQRWEGLLYPATYPIGGDATPTSILVQMADEMTARTSNTDWTRIEELGISRYEALVVASLIEREAGTDSDRRLISSVIYNRLAAGMRLQIDATVVYALGGVNGGVSAQDLKIESVYNTYLIDSLPPTPIGTIRDLSLVAAVQPATTKYLFYVLASEDGTHAFAESYEGHQANIAEAKKAGVLP